VTNLKALLSAVVLASAGGACASRLEILAKSAKAKHVGLWGACPHTPYDPYHGIGTRR
jgi:hypothetical protein